MILKKKNFGSKGNIQKNFYILRKYFEVFNNTLAKMSQNIFAYAFVSEHSMYYFYFEKKIGLFSVGGGSTPPPPFSVLLTNTEEEPVDELEGRDDQDGHGKQPDPWRAFIAICMVRVVFSL